MAPSTDVMGMAEQIEAANAPAKPKEAAWIEFTLPVSERKAKRMPFPKGKHMRLASKMSGDDRSLLPGAIAHYTCVVETEKGSNSFAKLTLEEIDDLDMADAAKLQSEAASPLDTTKTTQAAADAAIEAAIKAQLQVAESSPAST